MNVDTAFGKLILAARQQRGWTQEEVAQKWGHTREYVSQIERGKRKLERWEEIERLATILGISHEQLDAIGKSLPQRKRRAQSAQEADDVLFQALLEPSLATVKLSWLIWYSENNQLIVSHLDAWTHKLEDATSRYRGAFLKPSLQVLAYAHEMKGKICFDQLKYEEAMGQFATMLAIGEELNDPDIITLGLMYQGDILRKRGLYETAIRRLEAAEKQSRSASLCAQGMVWCVLARAHAAYGQEALFLKAIDHAQEIIVNTQQDLNTLSHKFSLVEVLQERAQGYSMLWRPEKAIEIYRETDTLRPFRPIRDLGSYTIVKAQAQAYNGNIEEGIALAIRGIELARQYHSKRHISRIRGMYDRLNVTNVKNHPRMRDLKEALAYAEED